MNFSLNLALVAVLFSCTVNEKKSPTEQNTESDEASRAAVSQPAETAQDWLVRQDSLRDELVRSKSNDSLKSSILKELYIRGLVSQKGDKFIFKLPFDLHGFDCGAPDCYTTQISFELAATKPISFPKNLPFTLSEFGCIEEESRKTGAFELQELTDEYVNYYSPAEGSNLLIFGNDERKEYVYYFPQASLDSIKGNLVSGLLNQYNDEDTSAVAPYRITTMLANEYEKFLEK